jgi:ribose transport system substrate-binding protein
VDAIVIAPGDSAELIPVLKQARDADIQVINIDNRLDPALSARQGLHDVPFISVDNEQGAYLAARHIGERITTPTRVAILEGIRGAANAEDRKNGALRAFAENPHITVVARESANWKIDEGYEVTRDLFARHPDLGALFAANDMMALGAIRYLQEIGRDGQVLVAAFDALHEAMPALRTGSLAVTIDQQAAQQGYLGVQYAVRALAGESLPAETLIDVLVVDATRLAADH